MTEFELSKILNAVGFSERYWALCERFPMHDGYHSYQGRKGDILEALAGMGIKPAYDKRDRSMTFEDETIAGVRITSRTLSCRKWLWSG